MDLIADTTFLVGLWRRHPWAMEFAAGNQSAVLGIPWVVLGEFWHGAVRAGHSEEVVERFLGLGIPLLDPAPVLRVYARTCATLQDRDPTIHRVIGQNDLWIAAVALQQNLPLLSRNRRHFDHIAGLKVVALTTD